MKTAILVLKFSRPAQFHPYSIFWCGASIGLSCQQIHFYPFRSTISFSRFKALPSNIGYTRFWKITKASNWFSLVTIKIGSKSTFFFFFLKDQRGRASPPILVHGPLGGLHLCIFSSMKKHKHAHSVLHGREHRRSHTGPVPCTCPPVAKGGSISR